MYPAGILHNTATNRYHPILFMMYPHPADRPPFGLCRYKSLGHHTAGFDTIGEAKADIAADSRFEPIDAEWDWDGSGVPAMVVFFSRGQDGKINNSAQFELTVS